VAYHGFKPAEQAIQIGDDEILSSHISDGVIVNADINSSAAIATSKVSGALTSVGSHGLATSATTDTTNASNISSGTLASARVATLNQNTTGQAGTVATIDGLAPNTATTQATQASITSAANLATVGTIGTGVWNGTAVASAYLDADTAHLSVSQTYTGTPTFAQRLKVDTDLEDIAYFDSNSVNGIYIGIQNQGTTFAYIGSAKSLVTTSHSLTDFVIRSNNSLYLTTGGITPALTLDSSQNATFAGDVNVATGDTPTLNLTETGGSSLDVYAGGGGSAVRTTNSTTFTLGTNSTTALTIDTNQNATFAGDVSIDEGGTSAKEFPFNISINSSTQQQTGLEIRQHTANTDARMRFKSPSGYCRLGMEVDGDFFIEPFNGSAYEKQFHLDAATGNATFAGKVNGVQRQVAVLEGDDNTRRAVNLGTIKTNRMIMIEAFSNSRLSNAGAEWGYLRAVVVFGSEPTNGGYQFEELEKNGSAFSYGVQTKGSDPNKTLQIYFDHQSSSSTSSGTEYIFQFKCETINGDHIAIAMNDPPP